MLHLIRKDLEAEGLSLREGTHAASHALLNTMPLYVRHLKLCSTSFEPSPVKSFFLYLELPMLAYGLFFSWTSSFSLIALIASTNGFFAESSELEGDIDSFLVCLGASEVPKIYGALSSFLQITMPSAVPQSRGHPYLNTHLKSTKTNIFFLLNTILALFHLRLVIASLNQKELLMLCKCQQVLVITIANLFYTSYLINGLNDYLFLFR